MTTKERKRETRKRMRRGLMPEVVEARRRAMEKRTARAEGDRQGVSRQKKVVRADVAKGIDELAARRAKVGKRFDSDGSERQVSRRRKGFFDLDGSERRVAKGQSTEIQRRRRPVKGADRDVQLRRRQPAKGTFDLDGSPDEAQASWHKGGGYNPGTRRRRSRRRRPYHDKGIYGHTGGRTPRTFRA